jgi:hypothetical protein
MACIGEKHRTSAEWAVIVKDRRRALAMRIRRSFHYGNNAARRSFASAAGTFELQEGQARQLVLDWGSMIYFIYLPEDPLMPFDRAHFYSYNFEDDYQVCEEQEVMLLKWTTLALDTEIKWQGDIALIQWRSAISIDELRRCSRVMQHSSMLLVEACGDSNYLLKYLSRKLKFILAIGAGRSGQLAKLPPLILEYTGRFLLGVQADWIPYPEFAYDEDCPLMPSDIDHFWHDELPVAWVDNLHEEFWRLRVSLVGFTKQHDFLRSEVDNMDAKIVSLLTISRGLAWNF